MNTILYGSKYREGSLTACQRCKSCLNVYAGEGKKSKWDTKEFRREVICINNIECDKDYKLEFSTHSFSYEQHFQCTHRLHCVCLCVFGLYPSWLTMRIVPHTLYLIFHLYILLSYFQKPLVAVTNFHKRPYPERTHSQKIH